MASKKECAECGKNMWFASSEEVWYCEDAECGSFEELSLDEELNKLLLQKAVIDEEINEIMRQLEENENEG